MELAARTGAWSGGKALPYLRRVAYLESHGSEYLELGFAQTKVMWEVVFRCESEYKNDVWMCGGFYSKNSARVGLIGRSTSDVLIGNVRYRKEGECVVDQHDENNYVRARSIKTQSFNTPGIVVFAQNWGGVVGHIIAKGKLVTIFDSNGEVLVMAIPVLDKSGRPCFYNQSPSAVPADDPSRFFYNQGTGEFTWGELDAASALVSSRGGVLNA